MPEHINTFFLNHIDYLEEHAVDVDKRRYSDKEEAPRHYIDIDHYHPTDPFKHVPRFWDAAVEKYSEDTLLTYGILPWHIERTYYQLVAAMEQRQKDRVLRLAAYLRH